MAGNSSWIFRHLSNLFRYVCRKSGDISWEMVLLASIFHLYSYSTCSIPSACTHGVLFWFASNKEICNYSKKLDVYIGVPNKRIEISQAKPCHVSGVPIRIRCVGVTFYQWSDFFPIGFPKARGWLCTDRGDLPIAPSTLQESSILYKGNKHQVPYNGQVIHHSLLVIDKSHLPMSLPPCY